jgi:hypothetical protein
VNPTIRTTLFTVLVFIAMPVGAAESGAATDSNLERRVVELEKRVSELEAISKNTPSKASRVATSGNWKDLQNWRQLRTTMSYDEVRALLGEPENIEGGIVARWYWGSGEAYVVFVSDRLQRWSEPK